MTRDRSRDRNRNRGQPPRRDDREQRIRRAAWRRTDKHPADTELGYDLDDWIDHKMKGGFITFLPSEMAPDKEEFILTDADKMIDLREWV